ncbi:MAG: hypothetical protein NTY81_03395 [Candidatus Staskawiczbacteria bacterium]|nr:hypothetical protein [Candidatus Staskawiczbacteria bacterium]
MKKIILLALIIAGTLSLSVGQIVLADASTLSVSPASANNSVGAEFDVLVQLNPANNKVCVVKGTIDLTNLSCQSITLASGVMAQTTPTCASPNFVLGIPKCSAVEQNLFSVSVQGIQAGPATLSIEGAKVIGAGADVASTLQNGTYNITAVIPTPVLAPIVAPKTPKPVQPVAQQELQPAQESQTFIEQTTTPENSENNVPTTAGTAGLSSIVKSVYFWPILIILIIVLAGYGIYYFLERKKEKK